MSMSMMGLAMRSGMEVDPMCSIVMIGMLVRIVSREALAARNSVAQWGLCRSRGIEGILRYCGVE